MSGYNWIAGRSVERLGALSDGVFSIAMTLLVLELRAPAVEAVRSDAALASALGALAPKLLVYGMSFVTLGIFWVGQQSQLHLLERTDRGLTWIHLSHLLAVTLVPFSTSLLGQFVHLRLALGVYWLNVFAMGAALYWAWAAAWGRGLVKQDTPEAANRAIRERIVWAQSLYGAGALLAFWNTYWAIGAILAVQMNYVFAPRWPGQKAKT